MREITKDYKEYLGDGAYADFDGFHIVLTTEDGISTTNRVRLDDRCLNALLKYIERLHDIRITIKKNELGDQENG